MIKSASFEHFLAVSLAACLLFSPLSQAQTGAPNKPSTTEGQTVDDTKSDQTSATKDKQSGANSEANTELAKKAEESPSKPPASASKTKPKREVFRPSEEISEDRPVPFPVDI